MLLRNLLLSICLAASWLASHISHAEAATTGTASGPLCRLAAWCAASTFHVGAYWGGDDALIQLLDSNPHLQTCVRECAAPTGRVAYLAHVLFEY